MKHSSPDHGFTLLELLMVITIIGILASMILPVTQSMTARSKTVACASNLRQLWAAVNAAAADNDNAFPEIKIKPDDSTAGEDAKELDETLKPYGITEKNLQCAADLEGPNCFATYRTSYMWQTPVEDESTSSVRIFRGRRVITAKPSRVALLRDYDTVHAPDATGQRKLANTIYMDGHVALR